jgi:hypothetical protein
MVPLSRSLKGRRGSQAALPWQNALILPAPGKGNKLIGVNPRFIQKA